MAHTQILLVHHMNRIEGSILAAEAREALGIRQIELPRIVTPSALTLDPEARQLFLAGHDQTGTHSIWVTDLPEAPTDLSPNLSLGKSLWQGRFEVRDLAVSPDRRWLLASGDGFLLFDLESGSLQAIVGNTGPFQAAFRTPDEVVYLENGTYTGVWKLVGGGLIAPRAQLPDQVADLTGLRVAGGEVLLEPDALEAYLHATRGR